MTAVTAPVQGDALATPPGVKLATSAAAGAKLLRLVTQPQEMLAAQDEIRDFIAKALVSERDYGVIPGTEKKDRDGQKVEKRTLLKPGAEKIALAFGCTVVTRIIEREIDHDRVVKWQKKTKQWKDRQFVGWKVEEGESIGLYRYVVAVDLVDATGAIVGTGIGSCSTMESKYIDRPRDCENTALKMAFKRAHFGLSDAFQQDLEDGDATSDAETAKVSPRDAEWPNWPDCEYAKRKFRDIPEAFLADQMKAAARRAVKATNAGDRDKAKKAQNLADACEAELENRRLEGHQPSLHNAPAATAAPRAEPLPTSVGLEERHASLDEDDDDGLPFD